MKLFNHVNILIGTTVLLKLWKSDKKFGASFKNSHGQGTANPTTLSFSYSYNYLSITCLYVYLRTSSNVFKLLCGYVLNTLK